MNPLLANPVYLAGYIEQVGTGTNDVIDRCVELGLRKPELTFRLPPSHLGHSSILDDTRFGVGLGRMRTLRW